MIAVILAFGYGLLVGAFVTGLFCIGARVHDHWETGRARREIRRERDQLAIDRIAFTEAVRVEWDKIANAQEFVR